MWTRDWESYECTSSERAYLSYANVVKNGHMALAKLLVVIPAHGAEKLPQ